MLVGIGAGVKQRSDYSGIAIDTGQPQRRRAITVRGFGISPCTQQQVDGLFIRPVDRPVKRRRTVGLGRIHIGVLLNELMNRQSVAVHDRVGNVGGAGARTDNRPKQQ